MTLEDPTSEEWVAIWFLVYLLVPLALYVVYLVVAGLLRLAAGKQKEESETREREP